MAVLANWQTNLGAIENVEGSLANPKMEHMKYTKYVYMKGNYRIESFKTAV
jgi:hypothetical protein